MAGGGVGGVTVGPTDGRYEKTRTAKLRTQYSGEEGYGGWICELVRVGGQ